jgi:hypothetical protein
MNMHTKEKVKMCPFCEGTIAASSTECKYCGSSLIKSQKRASAYQTEDSLASLYDPPYAPNKRPNHYGIPPSHIHTTEYDDDYEEGEGEEPPKRKVTDEGEDEEASSLGALLLLSIGGVLFTLAWLLLFFSEHGRLILEWKSRYWFAYLFLSLPLLYKGYKKL